MNLLVSPEHILTKGRGARKLGAAKFNQRKSSLESLLSISHSVLSYLSIN